MAQEIVTIRISKDGTVTANAVYRPMPGYKINLNSIPEVPKPGKRDSELAQMLECTAASGTGFCG